MEATVTRIAAKGDGVTDDGRHVPFSAPGDRIATNGTLILGPHHAEPPCHHFPVCGGCQLQHVDEASYATFVTQRVLGALAGQGVTAGAVLPTHISPPQTRRRVALRAMRQGKNLHIGFAEARSHSLVDLDMCAVMAPPLFILIEPLRVLLKPLIRDKSGAHVRMSMTDQGVDLVLEHVQSEGLAAAEALIDFAQAHGLARLSIDEGDGPETRWEPEPVTVSFGGVPVAFPPFAFLQATPDGERILVETVRAALGEAASLADLFCGLGTFALALGEGRTVYAAEAARDLTMALRQAGNRAQRRMGVDHRDLFRRPLIPAELDKFEAVLIDPPRAGAREQVMQIARSKVPLVAYVSCNPGSFARDAAHLIEGGYHLDSVRPVGQFRWSTHVEMAGIFRR